MLRKKVMVVILLVGFLGLSITWGADDRVQRVRDRSQVQAISQEQQAPNPYEDTSILAEAFVVRISNEALAEAGINPIGQTPEGISILKVLWCLKDKERAEVISGAKVMVRNDDRSKSKNEKTFYIKRESPIATSKEATVTKQSITFDPYESHKQFEIYAWVEEDNVVGLEYSYSEFGVSENEDAVMPLNQFSYDWSGRLISLSGKPMIAGAVQDEDETIFLILTATVQDSDN